MAIHGVDGVAVPIIEVRREANHQYIIDQRNIDNSLITPGIVVAVGHVKETAKFIGRARRDKQHGAACGVDAEQRSLRPLEDLQVFQVEKIA